MREERADPVNVGQTEPCRIVKLPEYVDARGSLSVIEIGETIGFEVKRVYYLYDLPVGTIRGAHGHRNLEQLLLALNGEFDVTVDDGFQQTRFHLDNPTHGLYIGPMVWRRLVNFSEGAIGLVLASAHYDEADYYREYDEFLEVARASA
jgi:oxalate decarboxylase/phosphoglucose isomerase-like protein (cupin superfamily)